MPFYMCQFAYTSEAWTAMTKNPQDRSKPMGELAQKLGSRIVGLASMAPGHLKVTRTTRLFTPTETVEIMRKAGSVNFESGPSSQWFNVIY